MNKTIIKALSIFIICIPILILVNDIYEDRQNKVTIEETTWLFVSPEDAASEGCASCPPANKVRKIEKNEKIKVKRTTYGKDYWALKVETENGDIGWVLSGQKGIKINKKI